MMRSLFSGVSGLRNHQIRMDVIGNNIANVNTVGYKRGRVTFQDMLSQNIRGASAPQGGRGGSNPQQIGLGMSVNSIDTIWTPGSSETTGKSTDMMINGDGFFILGNGKSNVYTRAGNFDFDTSGNLINPSGLAVQGWIVDPVTGTIDTSGRIQGITVQKGQSIDPKITTAVGFINNLRSDEVVGQGISVDVPAYDSLGNEHTLTYKLTKNAATNEWDYAVTLPDTDPAILDLIKTDTNLALTDPWGATVNGPFANYPMYDTTDGGGNAVTLTMTAADKQAILDQANNLLFGGATIADASTRSGKLVFDTNGALDQSATATANGLTLPNLVGALTFAPIGANAMTITSDFTKLTQFQTDSTFKMDQQDGYGSGLLSGFSIDKTGVVTGRFTNGYSKQLAQIAVANFNNPAGLVKMGENTYAATSNSGTVEIGEAGLAGRGEIAPGQLEMSNVDLSQEFTDMIITQRGFQANSRIITVSDEMLQELVNLKR